MILDTFVLAKLILFRDPSKASKELGWEAKPLEELVAEMVEEDILQAKKRNYFLIKGLKLTPQKKAHQICKFKNDLINREDSIFIAGHNGMVGRAIKKLEENSYNNLLLPSRKELDLSNESLVKDWFNKYRPKVVILAAAKVGGIEANKKYPADFILENIKIQTNIIENS